ncbi:MAG TPA: hypothetical protein VN775_02875 [Opitutaceae bacterium]|nr:hypothetical protein [Opitutaceae bacterium]
MDPETPETAKADPRARRARAIILVVMAVFIAAPVIVWLLTGRGAQPRP